MAGSAYAEIEEKMEGVSANICCDGWSLRCTRWSQGEEHTSSTGISMGIGQHLRVLLALHDEAGEAVKKRSCQQTLVLAVRVDATEINLSSSTLHAAFEQSLGVLFAEAPLAENWVVAAPVALQTGYQNSRIPPLPPV